MEDSTRDPKPRTACQDDSCVHGVVPPGLRPHALDRPGEQHGFPRHPCWGLPAALDGRIPMVIAHAELQELRDVAARSDCPLADMLLAVFGLVLDRHSRHKDASIAILSADPALPGRSRQWVKGDMQDQGGAAMPLDMRLAIAQGEVSGARAPRTSCSPSPRRPALPSSRR